MLVGRLVLHKAGEMLVLTRGKGWQKCGSVHFSTRAASWGAEAYRKVHLMVCRAEAADVILCK